MKELKKQYDIMIAQLKEEHDTWIKSNRKMRSIESARAQLKPIGDTDSTPALDILNEAYEEEKSRNDYLTSRMYIRREFIREIEVFARDNHGEEWNGTFDIFGY